MGNEYLEALQMGWAQDAKDIFLDTTSGKKSSVEPLASFGYLFLEKYNATDALGVFRDCLKINKRAPEVLLGIALAKKYESNDEVDATARAALEVNPNLVPAITLLAELRIQEENYSGAYQEI